MGHVIHTEEPQPWSMRVGGAYPTREMAERAADMVTFPVTIGAPHEQHGYFMVPAPPNSVSVQDIIDALLVAENDPKEAPGDYAQIARWIAKRFGGTIPEQWRL